MPQLGLPPGPDPGLGAGHDPGAGDDDVEVAVRSQDERRAGTTIRIAELTECLDLVAAKVEVYRAHVSQGTAHVLWSAPAQVTPPSAPDEGE
ncbi:MAG TPA: hypothetical protein VK453_28230 [Micromonosporaceae bacterium]|nr:hypothetical protein [Micromonosporaceae bacterium]